MDILEIIQWTSTFIGKHWEKGIHRWAFWLEGMVIGMLINHFWGILG